MTSAMTSPRQWLTPLGLVMVAVVVLSAVLGEGAAAGGGTGAVNTAAAAVFGVAAVLFLLGAGWAEPAYLVLMVLMAAGLVVMRTQEPGGQVTGLFLMAAFAPLRRPLAGLAVVVLLGILAFNVVQLGSGQTALGVIIATDAGAAFFFLVGVLLRREREQRERIGALLQRLEVSRQAEKEASAANERTRMARELHDVLAHTLSGLALHLEAARLLADATNPDPQLSRSIASAHQLSRAGLAEAKRAVGALRGEELPGPDMVPSLIDQHRLASPGPVAYRVVGEPGPLPPEGALALYRTVQEALSNVRKHAGDAAVDVSVDWGGDAVSVVVTDTGGSATAGADLAGTGPAPSADLSPGFGLGGMAERAELAGGSLTAGRRGGGFQVRLSVPVQGNAGPAEGNAAAGGAGQQRGHPL